MSAEMTNPPQPEIRRAEDFFTLYANQVYLEPSAWDLKLILGVLDQRGGKVAVDQFGQIMVPWVLTKVLMYWLQASIMAYEEENGKIPVPANAIPPEPVLPEVFKDNPVVQRIHEKVVKLRQEFIANLPPKL